MVYFFFSSSSIGPLYARALAAIIFSKCFSLYGGGETQERCVNGRIGDQGYGVFSSSSDKRADVNSRNLLRTPTQVNSGPVPTTLSLTVKTYYDTNNYYGVNYFLLFVHWRAICSYMNCEMSQCNQVINTWVTDLVNKCLYSPITLSLRFICKKLQVTSACGRVPHTDYRTILFWCPPGP